MPPRSGTPYRIARETPAPGSGTGDLEALLRARLRIATGLAALTAGGLGLATLFSNFTRIREHWSALFTIPPFAGPMLLMALTMAGLGLRLHLTSVWSLRQLKRVEGFLAGAWALFFVIIVWQDLRNLLPDIPHVPIDLAMAHSAMWGLVLVAYAVLIPSTPREGALRTTGFFLCSLVPVALVAAAVPELPAKFGVYLGTSVVMTGFYAALAAYGAYRIETLRRDAQSARQLGQYVLTTPLGSGGMGEVFLAEHRLLRRPCAVKLIRPEQAGDAATLRRFEREAQATAALTHPNTVQVYDYGIAEDGTFYYVMEYLPGTTLEELLKREGPQAPERVVAILAQLCGALQEAHDRGLVHRDIKPGNVILGERGGQHDVAKLLDFGLVAAVQRSSPPPGDGTSPQASLLVGTPAYMSPEQCGGDAEVGPASDLYSLGALAFTLLTGESPFAGRSPVQLFAAHLMERPRRVDAIRPGVPRELAAVVERCLAKAPEQRYPDARSLGAALHAALRPQAVAS